MPLVRIDLRKGKDAAYRKDIGRAVYEGLWCKWPDPIGYAGSELG